MTTRLDVDKIAQGLGAQRRGKVASSGGYFGALQLVADIEARFRVPAGGGRATDPRWTERRLVPLASSTLQRLDELAAKVRKHSGIQVEPMQLAALLLERATDRVSDHEADELVSARARPSRRVAG